MDADTYALDHDIGYFRKSCSRIARIIMIPVP
jgi:hypothetical protein